MDIKNLQHLNKHQLIDTIINLNEQLSDKSQELSNKEFEIKFISNAYKEVKKELEEKNDERLYNEWKKHTNVDFLNRYLKEWVNEHIEIEVECNCEEHNTYTVTGTLLIDKNPVKSTEGWFRT